MGLKIAPSIWQSYINVILDCLQSRKYCEAIMDDLLLFTPSKGSHIAKLEDILKRLLKNGLKISLKKCQLFRTELIYMGNTINFLSMFCPELQKLLKSIYDLTRKARHFIWEKEQQNAIPKIKCRLIKPPALHLPNSTSRFHLYSDTSKFAIGSALYQIQSRKPKLKAYASKRLPEAARNYSITELELCG